MIGLVLVIFIMGGVGYAYFSYSQLQIQVLTQNNAKLETAVDLVQKENNNIKKSFAEQSQNNEAAQKRIREIHIQLSELETKINKHNLEVLAVKKPGLIENRINVATKKLFRDLEREVND